MPAVVIALSFSVLVIAVAFGVLALAGRQTIMRTLKSVEGSGGGGCEQSEIRRRYQVLLEGCVYPKTYLLFGERERIATALDRLARQPGFVPVAPPHGPSILHANPYFKA